MKIITLRDIASIITIVGVTSIFR